MSYKEALEDGIPVKKVALEIDGVVYHGKEKQASDIIRDEVVCLALGKGWQVIRIKTDNINTNVTKLIPAIKKVLRYRKTS